MNKKAISLYKSQEIERNTSIKYPFNSITSFIYLILLLHFYNKTFTLFNLIGILIIISLTISSYLWWAYRDAFVQKIDIISYSSIIYYVGFLNLINNSLSINYRFNISILFIILVYFITLITENNNNFLIKLINIIGVLFSVNIILENNINNKIKIGLILTFFSFVFKICDTFNFINFNNLKLCSGTGWFHILSGIGLFNLIDIQ